MQKVLEKISELWGWVVIVFAFAGLGLGCAFILFYLIHGLIGKVIGSIIGLAIIYTGVYVATKVYKGKGTIHALSRTIATTELDNNTDLENGKL